MIKSGFNYLKGTAVVAVLAITIIVGVHPSTATNQPTPPAVVAPGADLANEDRALAKYFDDLVAYDKQSGDLGKKALLVKADLDPLQRRSDDLKGRLSGLQNVIREVVKKLKAANEWDDLDITIAAKITNPSQRAKFKENSFKQLLEEASNNLNSHGNDLNTPLDKLRKRLTSRTFSPYGEGSDLQIVRAAYEAPVPVKLFRSLGCAIAQIHLGLIGRLGGVPTDEQDDQMECACTGFYNGDVPCTK